MNKKISTVLRTLFLLTLIISIGAITVEASQLRITKLYVKSLGDGYITADVTTSGSGTFGVSIDKAQVWSFTVTDVDIGAGSQFEISSGKHDICAYDINNKEAMMICTTIIIQTSETDKQPPEFARVVLSTYTPHIGEKIDVMVNVNDNVGIARVTVNDVETTSKYWNTWICQLTAFEGKHDIFVIAYDKAGNKATDYSQSYTSKVVSTPTLTPTSISTTTLITTLNITNTTPTSTPTPTSTSSKMGASTSRTTDTYGKLIVDSDPSGADIVIDNVHYGNTPYSLQITTGSHALRITKEDYKDFTKMVNVRENMETNVIAKLVPLNETIYTENNQTNQSVMINDGNSKQQNNGDSTTSLINNLIILTAIIVIVSGCIIYRILSPQKNAYINYPSPQPSTNEKSVIVLKRVGR